MLTEAFRVGRVECRRFIHGRSRGRPQWMFPDVPAAPLARRMAPYLADDGRFEYVYSSLLLKAGTDVALLDTSLPAASADERSSIDHALAAIDVRPSDVGTVVISHGHLDHIGGLIRSAEPAFDGARHVIHRRELEYWTSGVRSRMDAASILLPIVQAGLLDPVDEEQEVLPGVRVIPTPGHTPGHTAVEIASDGETAIYVGDVLAHEVNFTEPDWNHFSDMLPDLAVRSRRRLVERAFRQGAVVVGSHMNTPFQP